VAEYAAGIGVRHIPDVKTNKMGDLDTSSILEIGQNNATHDIVALLDCDVILLGDFVEVAISVAKQHEQFLLVGYRRDVNGIEELSFHPGWEHHVHEAFESRGRLFRKAGGSDYSIFRRGFYRDTPPFSLGKGHWDGWMMWYALEKNAPMIDCTDVICAIHQHHEHRSFRSFPGEQENFKLCGEDMRWLKDATYRKFANENEKEPIVSPNIRIRRPDLCEIGNYSIIDDYVYISCALKMGRFSHIAANCTLLGGGELITIGDFVNIAPGCRLASASQNYTGGGLAGPCIPPEHRGSSIIGEIVLSDHVLLGCNTVVLPGVYAPEGLATGAGTLLTAQEYKPWTLYVGVPARPLKTRDSARILRGAQELLKWLT
jgi:galactoside O-acetyltransferase